MDNPVIVIGAVCTLVSAVAGAITGLITSRATGRKTTVEAKGLEAKLPAEIDSVVVQGAEAAVLTMGKALESANTRIHALELEAERREREREADRARMADLEREVAELRSKVAVAEQHLAEARTAGDRLAAELRQTLEAQDNRKHQQQ